MVSGIKYLNSIMTSDYIFPIVFVSVFVAVLVFVVVTIFTKKGRLLSAKIFFWGGDVIKDYGWLDESGTINALTKQRIQVLKYKKGDEVFYVLLVKDTTVASVQMLSVKLSEQEAQKLVSIFSEKNE
jgi:hypothetical protein